MRKPKTHLLHVLQNAFYVARKSEQENISADEILNTLHESNIKRKTFLKHAALGMVAMSAGTSLSSCKKEEKGLKKEVRIGIIGGGIAGLHAAYVLKKSGYYAEIFEGNTRAGGRIYTKTDLIATGITTELGGEFIDSDHEDLRNLAAEFGLNLFDLQSASETALTQDRFYFGNQLYTLADVVTALQPFSGAIQADIDTLPDEINYSTTDAAVIALDNTSLANYLQQKGITGWLYDFIKVAYLTEYGLEIEEQSCINFLFLFDPAAFENDGETYGTSDERYKIEGGNQQLIEKLVAEVPSLTLAHTLASLKMLNNKYELNFTNGTRRVFDIVVLAIPFTTLRDVDIQVELPQVKKDSIQQLGYGKNAKLFAGFNSRIWRTQNFLGEAFTDKNFQLGWDSSQMQPGTAGGYSFFVAGNESDALGNSSLDQKRTQYLQQLENVFPGVAADYNGRSEKFHWPSHPFTKGSYACYKTGQWTTIGGAEIEPVGNLFFAGEHCSANFQGFMNGGAETGRLAAENILAVLTA